jgi:hypothetical protein
MSRNVLKLKDNVKLLRGKFRPISDSNLGVVKCRFFSLRTEITCQVGFAVQNSITSGRTSTFRISQSCEYPPSQSSSKANKLSFKMPFQSCCYLTITELIHLLETFSISRDEFTLKVADRRLTCGINGCQWQGIDNTNLSNHVQTDHEEGKSDICRLQRVITETELQQMASNGTKVIDGVKYHVVEPVCYLFAIGGGKWYSCGQENLYSIQKKLTVKEADLLKELHDTKERVKEELTRKDQAIKAVEDATDLAREQIERLRHELDEREADLRDLQNATLVDVTVEAPLKRETDADTLCESLNADTEKLDKLATGLRSALKDVSNRAQESEKKQDLRIKELEREVSLWKGAHHANKELVENAIATHKRFFLYAKEGMIDRNNTFYKRSEPNSATLKKGNDVAHRANIAAHLIIFRQGELSGEEVVTFQNMYGFHPTTETKTLMSPTSIELFNLMGTMAGIRSHHKFGTGNVSRYKEFLSLAEATGNIRLSVEKSYGTSEDAKSLFDDNVEIGNNLVIMKKIVGEFTAKEKAVCSGE